MNNSIFKFLDNTGCYFYSENDYFVLGKSLAGYSGINTGHVGLNIPYLCRSKNGQYEVGNGEIVQNNGRIVLKRIDVLASSYNNNPVPFAQDPNNALYCFANSSNFRIALNNFIKAAKNFFVENTRSTYFVDITQDDATATLPSVAYNKSLVVEFQTSSSASHHLYIKDSDNNTIVKLYPNGYTKLISTGSEWIELKDYSGSSPTSFSSASFSALSTEAAGATGTLQYNNNGSLDATNLYFNGTDQLLLGSDDPLSAYAVLPLSGNGPTLFNNSLIPSDFIVKGSGDKNLFFGYEGRLGINIPSGVRPQTALHIINNNCQDAIRLENRNPCYTANLTLYHKPTTVISPNSIISTINLSSKNSINNQVDFVQLRTKALSATAGATSGEFSIMLDKSGNKIETLSTNADSTTIRGSNNSIQISSSGININGSLKISDLKWSLPTTSGSILMSDNNGNIVLTNISNSPIINLLDPETVVFTGVCT